MLAFVEHYSQDIFFHFITYIYHFLIQASGVTMTYAKVFAFVKIDCQQIMSPPHI